MTRPVRIEMTIAAPVDAVWHALRDRDTLHQWHGWQFEDDGLTKEIDLIYFSDDVRADADSRRLEVGGRPEAGADGDVFTVEPDAAGAKLVLTRALPAEGSDWEAYYDDITEGWITFMHQLRFVLEQRPETARRTLFFTGPATSGSLVDALGVEAVATAPLGSRYEADLAGESVTGTVWFRSDRQAGFTVDAWGPGLLIVMQMEPIAERPDGAAQAVLSTYGMSDSAFQSLEQRWTAWWNRHQDG